MTMLVTLEEAKLQIRNEDIDVEDFDIVLKIEAASAAVLAYLKTYEFVDDDGEVDEDAMPSQVKQATLMLVGIMVRDRDGPASIETSAWGEQGYLPNSVTALLYQLRDPAMA